MLDRQDSILYRCLGHPELTRGSLVLDPLLGKKLHPANILVVQRERTIRLQEQLRNFCIYTFVGYLFKHTTVYKHYY